MNNYQFFSHANDSQLKRKLVENLNLTASNSGIKREALVDNIENGFDRIECHGWTQGGTDGQPERWYLLMKEPISFEIGGKARQIEALINNLQPENESSSKGPMKIINVGKVGVQQISVPDKNGGIHHTHFAYEVDRPIKANGEYELLISKVNRVL